MKFVVLLVLCIVAVSAQKALWERLERADPTATISFRLALPQKNLDVLEVFTPSLFML